jgi:hypothetical protein
MKTYASTLSSMSKSDAASIITRAASFTNVTITVLSSNGWLFPTTSFCVQGEEANIENFQKYLTKELNYRDERRREQAEAEERREMEKARQWLAKSNPLTRVAVRHESLLLLLMGLGFLGTLIGFAASVVMLAMFLGNEVSGMAPTISSGIFCLSLLSLKYGLRASNAPKEQVLKLMA